MNLVNILWAISIWLLAAFTSAWLLRTCIGTFVLELVTRTEVPVYDPSRALPLEKVTERKKRIRLSWVFVALGPLGLAAIILILVVGMAVGYVISLAADQSDSIR